MVFRPLFFQSAFAWMAGAALLVSGCSSQAQESAQSHVVRPILPKAPAKPKAASATDKPATGKGATGAQSGEAAATQAPAPAKNYAVVASSLGNSAPAEVLSAYTAAMKKVALAPPPADFKVAPHPRVEFDTVHIDRASGKPVNGKFVFELDATKAPLNVKSFVYLASKGFYKNSRFHRQEDLTGDGKGMIIQGGDPLTADPRTHQFAGMGGAGYTVPLEISDLQHDQYVIAAARTNDPDSASGQFYITQGAPHFLDGKYTVFGRIVQGKEVAARLEREDKLVAVKVLEAPPAGRTAKAP